MANKYAVANGNFADASTWSDLPGGAPGAVPPAAGDNAYSNTKNVIIAANATCTKISNQAENSAAAGGYFSILPGVTLTANVTAGTTNCLLAAFPVGNSCTISGNLTGGSAANASALYIAGRGTVNVVGTVDGGTVSTGYGIFTAMHCTLNITGALNPAQTGGTALYIGYWNTTASVNGNIYGTSLATTNTVIFFGSETSVLNVVGNVMASPSTTAVISIGNAAPTLNVTGSINGPNVAGVGIQTGFYSKVNVTGSAIAGNAGSAIVNNTLGAIVKVTRVVGNGYGTGSSGPTQTGYAINTNNVGVSYTEEIQFGSLGNSPVSGQLFITPITSNIVIFYKGAGATKTLVDAASVSGALPAVTDVRYGTSYNYGDMVGTCYVPTAGQTDLGTPVDNTTGTAVLIASDIWNTQTSTLTTVGSIGERMKHVATVASTGQQLSNAVTV